MIQALHQQGYSLRDIATIVGCARTTIYYEIRRGTPKPNSNRGRKPQYTAKRGQKAYEEHRKHSRRPLKIYCEDCEPFIQWMVKQVRDKRLSLDACVGYARRCNLFNAKQIPCTKTLYNMLWAGKLPLSLFDIQQALRRKAHRKWTRKNKRIKGRSTRNYIAIRIPERTKEGMEVAISQLKEQYGINHFSTVFKTMTADNGPEFTTFSNLESMGTKVYFAHPYSSWVYYFLFKNKYSKESD